MYGHSRNSIQYIHIQLMVAAMESLLTAEQSTRILKAAEMGGFDAGMTSLARVSDQIAAEKAKEEIAAATSEKDRTAFDLMNAGYEAAEIARLETLLDSLQPVIYALCKVDTSVLGSLEAITKLSELKRMAGQAVIHE